MRRRQLTKARWLMLATLGAFATIVPAASADTTYPVWTCRASAGYVEVNPLLSGTRVEPVLANGFPNRDAPDTEQCATQSTGVQTLQVPPAAADPLLTLEAASASTSIANEVSPASTQIASADAGVAETARVSIPGLVVDAEAITAEAQGRCLNGAPRLTGASTIVNLTINGTPIVLAGEPQAFNLAPLITVKLNEQERNPTPAAGPRPAGEELIQRAVVIELLTMGIGEPVARVVLGTQFVFVGVSFLFHTSSPANI